MGTSTHENNDRGFGTHETPNRRTAQFSWQPRTGTENRVDMTTDVKYQVLLALQPSDTSTARAHQLTPTNFHTLILSQS